MTLENLQPFPKGKSGNPGGRPKMSDDVKAALHSAAPDAIAKLIALIADSDPRVALVACEKVLDRVYGKPAQSVEHSGPDGSPIETADVSELEVARRVAFILAKATKD